MEVKVCAVLATASTVLGLLAGSACSQNRGLSDGERARIVHSVDSATRAFADAERARDPVRVLAHIAPTFYMYGDGTRVEYSVVAAQVRETMPTLRTFETVWEPIEVTVLGQDHALVTFTFRDSLVLGDETVTRAQGPTTLIWERTGPGWQIIYADADHYPFP